MLQVKHTCGIYLFFIEENATEAGEAEKDVSTTIEPQPNEAVENAPDHPASGTLHIQDSIAQHSV